ncbi:MAG: glycoside hydrolase, partial [Massilibacteroides sp.]|nr:glycoside hydrolase [Massilibacteroides sp.]
MKIQNLIIPITGCLFFLSQTLSAQQFDLSSSGYFQDRGVEVMAFDDIYPEGHQGGVSLIMHGNRVATNGNIRLEPTPGQWQPVPKQRNRKLDHAANTITAWLSFPDSSRHLTGFNPMIYPDLTLDYVVTVKGEGRSVIVTVDLNRPIPTELIGKVGFNFELFPGALFGKPWIMDGKSGIFPQQPNGPTLAEQANIAHTGNFNPDGQASIDQLIGHGYSPIIADDIIAEPYAVGRRFTVRPDDPYNR